MKRWRLAWYLYLCITLRSRRWIPPYLLWISRCVSFWRRRRCFEWLRPQRILFTGFLPCGLYLESSGGWELVYFANGYLGLVAVTSCSLSSCFGELCTSLALEVFPYVHQETPFTMLASTVLYNYWWVGGKLSTDTNLNTIFSYIIKGKANCFYQPLAFNN